MENIEKNSNSYNALQDSSIKRLEKLEREGLSIKHQTTQKTTTTEPGHIQSFTKSAVTSLPSTAMAIGQGFGYIGKKVGLGSGLYDVSTRGAQWLEKLTEKEREAHPWTSGLGGLVADYLITRGFGTLLGKTGVQLLPKVAPVYKTALTGAGMSMLTPVTREDEEDESFVSEKLKQGALGAVGGIALHSVGEIAQSIAKRGVRWITNKGNKIIAETGDGFQIFIDQKKAKALGIEPPASKGGTWHIPEHTVNSKSFHEIVGRPYIKVFKVQGNKVLLDSNLNDNAVPTVVTKSTLKNLNVLPENIKPGKVLNLDAEQIKKLPIANKDTYFAIQKLQEKAYEIAKHGGKLPKEEIQNILATVPEQERKITEEALTKYIKNTLIPNQKQIKFAAKAQDAGIKLKEHNLDDDILKPIAKALHEKRFLSLDSKFKDKNTGVTIFDINDPNIKEKWNELRHSNTQLKPILNEPVRKVGKKIFNQLEKLVHMDGLTEKQTKEKLKKIWEPIAKAQERSKANNVLVDINPIYDFIYQGKSKYKISDSEPRKLINKMEKALNEVQIGEKASIEHLTQIKKLISDTINKISADIAKGKDKGSFHDLEYLAGGFNHHLKESIAKGAGITNYKDIVKKYADERTKLELKRNLAKLIEKHYDDLLNLTATNTGKKELKKVFYGDLGSLDKDIDNAFLSIYHPFKKSKDFIQKEFMPKMEQMHELVQSIRPDAHAGGSLTASYTDLNAILKDIIKENRFTIEKVLHPVSQFFDSTEMGGMGRRMIRAVDKKLLSSNEDFIHNILALMYHNTDFYKHMQKLANQ